MPATRSLARRRSSTPRAVARADLACPASVQPRCQCLGGAEDERGVVSAEAHRVGERGLDRSGARFVRYVVEVECGVGRLVVDRRRDAPIAHGQHAGHGLERPSRTEQVTGHRLRRRDHELVGVVAEHALDRGRLLAVVRLRRGPMRVDVVDIRWLHSGLVERHLHGARVSFSLGRWRRDVVRVGGRTVADELAIDLRFAGERALALLEDENCGTFRENEAVTIFIERPRGLGRGIVAPAHRVHRRESADRERKHRGLRPSRHHDIRLPALDQLGALAKGVRARGTRRNMREARPAYVELHRDLGGAGVRHQHRNKKRGESRRSPLLHEKHLVDQGLDAAHSRRDRDADPVSVGSATLEARVLERLRGGGHRVLRESVGAPDLLAIHVFRWIEALDLACDLRLVRRGVEARDPADPAPPVNEGVPRARHVEPKRCHGAEAGDDDAPGHRGAEVARSRRADSAPVIDRGSDTLRSFTSAMRFTRPLTTWPAPISTNVDAPRSAMYLTERSHSTRFERCRTSASGIADADGCGIALTLATIGTTGSWKCSVCMNAARSGPIRPMSGKWNGADIRSGTTFRAPCLVSASLARATLSLSPAIVTCDGPLSFATTALPTGRTSLITRSTSSAGSPTIAAIAPLAPRDAASRPRSVTRRSASWNVRTPAATSAVNSPREWPATNLGRRLVGRAATPRGSTPSLERRPSFALTDSMNASRIATLVVRIAGCATVVLSRSPDGPSKQIFERSYPMVRSASSKMSRARADCS